MRVRKREVEICRTLHSRFQTVSSAGASQSGSCRIYDHGHGRMENLSNVSSLCHYRPT